MANCTNPEEELELLGRGDLQQYLKEKQLPANGTTAVLRQRYLESRRSQIAAAATATAGTACVTNRTGDAATSSNKKDTPKKSPAKAATTRGPEKRLKRYRTTCSTAVRQRIQRAKTQRLYLVEPPQLNDQNNSNNIPPEFQFVVMGSTGNLYSVCIGPLIQCNCPDHAKGNVCKHILFVMLKVLGLPDHSPLIYQTALLSTELEYIRQQLPTRLATATGAMANARVQRAYQQSKTTSPNHQPVDDTSTVQRQPIEGDCPICFDPLIAKNNNESLVFCQAVCGANFHLNCIQLWKRGKPLRSVTCPNCRSPWQDDEMGGNSKKPAQSPEGYTNLGSLQGQSLERDASTYSEWYGGGGGSSGSYRRGRRRPW